MEDTKRLTVVQMNDSHAYFDLHQELFRQGNQEVYRPAGGYARIAALVKQMRGSCGGRLLFCDNGDTFHGTYPAAATQGTAMVPVLNALGLDAMTVHWEFAYGPQGLKELAKQLDFPVLAINVFDKTTNELVFPPSIVKEVDGLRVGLIGIASNIVDKTMPALFSEGVYFTLGKQELPTVIDKLRTQDHADLIILISHLGFPQDMKLLSKVPGVDLCLSGHTHNCITRPVRQGTALLIQSGCHGSFLGRIDLEISGGKIIGFEHQLIEVALGVTPDPAVEDIVRRELKPFRDMLAQVAGRTATALSRAAMLETTMDNFLLEAILDASGAQLAFSNGWRYGAPVIPGPVTLNDLYNIIPMDPPIGLVDLTGDEIIMMLEEYLERTFAADPYEQMGGYIKRGLGFTVYFKAGNPSGQRIQQVFAADGPLEMARIYQAAFVTQQGVAQKYGRNRREMGMHAVGAMREYLAKHDPLVVELRGTYLLV